jgi:hypothetical protein
MVCRAFDAQVDDIQPEDRTLVARLNTDEIDRYVTVIDARGGRFENYRKLGGPLFWEHGKDVRRGSDPVGSNVWIKKSGGRRVDVIGKYRFLKDDFSQQRYEWYRDGVLRGFSVNILPDMDQSGPPTKAEIAERPELEDMQRAFTESRGQRGIIFRSWDLAEVSCTGIPGNASAITIEQASRLMRCVDQGLWLPDDVLTVCRTMTSSEGGMSGGGAAMKPNDGKCHAKQINGKWHAMNERGESMGEFDDKESAEKHAAGKGESKGSRSAPVIIESDGVWWIDEGDRRSVSFPERHLAEECLTLMRAAPSIPVDLMIMSSVGEIIRSRNEIRQEAEDWVNLYTRGHCGSER